MSDVLKDRETLYKLIISQLRYDGLDLVASSLARCVGLEDLPLAPSSRLLELVKFGLLEEKAGREPELDVVPGLTPRVQPEATGLDTNVKLGLDLEYERDDRYAVGGEETMNNLGLLSDVSLIDSLRDSNASTTSHSSLYTNKYMCESKLDFFCNLNLIPTPLVKDCPNATRNWLKMSEKCSMVTDVSINNICDFDFQKRRISFADLNIKHEGTQCLEMKLTPASSETDFRETDFDCLLHESILSPGLCPSIVPKSMLENDKEVLGTFESAKCITYEKFLNPSFKPLQDSLTILCKPTLQVSNQSGLTGKKKYKADVSRSGKYSNLYELVLKEISLHDINQTIFSKTVINKTQGYLSDILRSKTNKSLTKVESHLSQIKRFLKKPVSERQKLYQECIKNKTESATVQPLKKMKRTLLLKSDKELLIKFYNEKKGLIKKNDLEQIGSTLSISAESVKVFYKNMKQRNVHL